MDFCNGLMVFLRILFRKGREGPLRLWFFINIVSDTVCFSLSSFVVDFFLLLRERTHSGNCTIYFPSLVSSRYRVKMVIFGAKETCFGAIGRVG